MAKRSSLVRIGLATVLALVLMVVMVQSAFAKVSWCDEDLITMAAPADSNAQPQATDNVLPSPNQVPDIAKRGTNDRNPNK